MKRIPHIFLFLSLLAPVVVLADWANDPIVIKDTPISVTGTKIFDYDFEDWTGDAATTPNYFSSNNADTYWQDHVTATEVVQAGNSNCGDRDAHTGNYYFHQNFYDGARDPCLGTTPRSINPHTNIGFNGPIPQDPKNNFDISEEQTTDTMTIRFYFRTTDNWPNAQSNAMKFIRVYGEGGSSQMILLSDDGVSFDITDHPHPDNQNPRWSDYHNIFNAPINWNDHEWHSVVMILKRLNDNNIAPNLEVSAWWDDWDRQGPADGTAETYVSDFGSHISHVPLFVNWGATYPDSSMGIDMDDIEIWDGMPSVSHLNLTAVPVDEAIHLNWTVGGSFPVTATWQIAYDGLSGDQSSPIIDIPNPTRAYTLTGLTNYTLYTITLNAMLDSTPILTDTVTAVPTDIFVHLPVVMKRP